MEFSVTSLLLSGNLICFIGSLLDRSSGNFVLLSSEVGILRSPVLDYFRG
jgi:hypothetical protein